MDALWLLLHRYPVHLYTAVKVKINTFTSIVSNPVYLRTILTKSPMHCKGVVVPQVFKMNLLWLMNIELSLST